MGERLYRFACLAALAFWMGGFTFYALVVIPTGNRLLGSIQQGLLTQQVTHWMNLIGLLALMLLLPGAGDRNHSPRVGLRWPPASSHSSGYTPASTPSS